MQTFIITKGWGGGVTPSTSGSCGEKKEWGGGVQRGIT